MALDGPPNPEDDLARLRRFIDRLPAVIGYWDRDERNVIANDAYFDYFGITPDEIHGRSMREILGRRVYAYVRPHVEGVLRGETQVFESSLPDRHGEVRHFESTYIPDLVDGEIHGFFVQGHDVTARVQAEKTRDEAFRLFQLRMANAPFGEAVLTTNGHALLVNPALCQLVGCTTEELSGSTYRDFVHADELAAAVEEHRQLIAGEVDQISAEHRYLRPDGTTIWVQRNAVLAPGHEYGVEDVIIAQFIDVTARRVAEAQLSRLAVTDQLTGLRNRHALVAAVEQHRTAAPGTAMGLIFVDLDGFKQVNDKHGHAAGDTVLIEVGRRLSLAAPEPNSVYRLGGDEFVVLVPGAPHEAVVAGLAATVCSALTGRYDVGCDPFHLTASVGSTVGLTDDAEELIRQADIDMYRHKARLRESAV
ncbi:diguanylate cyclase (GGDEF)-like protein/PAS domain S-box-containing protein [Mycolicibacterium sp. BK556]|uniref:sensor domain-containing diguanylate cyclase n=1 Tax=Mycobacteriaceae TaxID=1762 RepID=UPI00105B2E07|nr:sensor domain-containing diguanylate cyclase [Mycobacterium sp. BK086]MBB3603897.1 diguanylate cyclase (GGDEF)-like protein/PAS domain S-box-containing protein [Mycolicibacterium sp. BK556]MBB3634092.1 diguanylate cyclase (GGDEF)-like protein/PAS domain S-box-containing protein [Mycolicibacterium sp. BK607]TDO12187.1 PAS domain S-box-containing protein/diguanylate cyclase (GGDEF)-like protein [Mycobacterium sp. BK086]